MGSGFFECVYQEALEIEFKERNIPFVAQEPVQIRYKGHTLCHEYVPDFLCFDQVIVEIKAISRLTSAEEGQLLNYLAATDKPVGVLLNFGLPRLEWKRMISTHGRNHGGNHE